MMISLRRLFSWKSLQGLLARRRRPDRCVTLIGAAEQECEQLLKRAGFTLQVPRDQDGMAGLAGRASAGPAYEALYLTGSRWRRLQRWAFHLPQRAAGGVTFEAGAWETDTDSAVACIRCDRLLDGKFHADEVHLLAGAIGRAAEKGRLRRVAIALTGMPPDAAPRHRGQVRLELPTHSTLRGGLGELLEQAAGKGGDPLADPAWRRFLADRIAESVHLSTLAQLLSRMTGRACTLLFIPVEEAGVDLTPVMEWIHGTFQDRPVRPQRAATALTAVASLALCALLVAGASLPAAPAGTASPLAAPLNPADLKADIERLDRGYEAASLKMIGALAGMRFVGRRALDDARDAVDWRVKVDLGTGRDRYLEQCVAAAYETLRNLQGPEPAARAEIAGRLAALLQEQMPVWRDVRSDRAASALAEAAVLRAWLTMKPDDDGFGPWSMDEETLKASSVLLDELLGHEAGRALLPAGRAESPADLAARFCAMSSIPGPVGAAAARFGPFLPRPDGKALLDRLEGLPLPALVKEAKIWKPRLAALLSANEGCLTLPLVPAEIRDRANALKGAADAAMAPRPMLLSFTSPYQPRFHLDFSLRPRDRFEGALRPLGAAEGCRAAVRLAPGGVLYVAVNWATEEHVVGSASGGRCGAADVIPIALDVQKGSVQTQGQTLNWEIIDGWPDWPAPSTGSPRPQETKP